MRTNKKSRGGVVLVDGVDPVDLMDGVVTHVRRAICHLSFVICYGFRVV
jgi:hypothetical protein